MYSPKKKNKLSAPVIRVGSTGQGIYNPNSRAKPSIGSSKRTQRLSWLTMGSEVEYWDRGVLRLSIRPRLRPGLKFGPLIQLPALTHIDNLYLWWCSSRLHSSNRYFTLYKSYLQLISTAFPDLYKIEMMDYPPTKFSQKRYACSVSFSVSVAIIQLYTEFDNTR